MIYSFEGRAPQISEKAYISDSATIIGDVIIEQDCYVGPGAILRADEGTIHICEGCAVEDGVIIHSAPEIPEIGVIPWRFALVTDSP